MPFEPSREKVAVVTGGAGGIGLGMARAFAGVGMKVVIADIDAERVTASGEVLRAAGNDVLAIQTDVSRLDSVAHLATAAMDTYGRVDVLCNNAGVGIFSRIGETTIEEWEWAIGINLWGPIYGVKTFLPLIERNAGAGHINATASISGLIAGGTVAPYNVTKHGVVALMATLEREFRSAKTPHRASVLCPGPINTQIGRNSVNRRRADLNPEGFARAADTTARAGSATQDTSDVTIALSSSQTGKKLGGKLSGALASGMHPDRVGEIVLDAIINDKFWIFTHKSLLKFVREQSDLMETEQLLSRGKLV